VVAGELQMMVWVYGAGFEATGKGAPGVLSAGAEEPLSAGKDYRAARVRVCSGVLLPAPILPVFVGSLAHVH
jgi:hypothetical protein